MDLSRPDRAARLDALAAEYALGTLPARTRARLDRVARDDATVARALRDWEQRIAALADGAPPIQPAPRVWTSLARRLGLDDGATDAPWWRRLGFWRPFALASFVAAFALAVTLVAPRSERPVESIVVVLAGPDARPALVASVPRGDRFLAVKALAPVAVPADRALELWMLPGQGPPRSLGLIPAEGVAQLRLAAPPDMMFRGIDALAVSLEPAGGSPTGLPTGPVLYTGRVERL
ncbi:MAG TPA: anti-sigma factor [Casimicrobiaceae bacterium]|jgi:anti-sigma-K factor RskA|nr:anti-sigma factor [Casimicrobiaceae bacterium]